MPRKTRAHSNSRNVQREAALLRETQALFLALAACLDGLLAVTRGLWERLSRTDAYRRAHGQDNGAGDVVWDLAGTIDTMLARDLGDAIDYLRRDARRAGVAAARRERR